MTLKKAIEILQHENYLDPNLETPDIISALILGIEGLNRWKERHDRCPDDINFLLPGETKD